MAAAPALQPLARVLQVLARGPSPLVVADCVPADVALPRGQDPTRAHLDMLVATASADTGTTLQRCLAAPTLKIGPMVRALEDELAVAVRMIYRFPGPDPETWVALAFERITRSCESTDVYDLPALVAVLSVDAVEATADEGDAARVIQCWPEDMVGPAPKALGAWTAPAGAGTLLLLAWAPYDVIRAAEPTLLISHTNLVSACLPLNTT